MTTQTGRKALARAAAHPRGINAWVGPKTPGMSMWVRMHERLCEEGMMRRRAGGIAYEITNAGRAEVAAVSAPDQSALRQQGDAALTNDDRLEAKKPAVARGPREDGVKLEGEP